MYINLKNYLEFMRCYKHVYVSSDMDETCKNQPDTFLIRYLSDCFPGLSLNFYIQIIY